MIHPELIRILLSAALTFTVASGHAKDLLYPGEFLESNNFISSPNGKYTLIMQSDGSLVMYRSNGTIRYAMEKHGTIAVMQHDGNFVQYVNTTPLWATYTFNTAGYPANYLKITDTGNLRVETTGMSPKWQIGDDPNPDGVSPAPTGMVANTLSSPPPTSIPPHGGHITGSADNYAIYPRY